MTYDVVLVKSLLKAIEMTEFKIRRVKSTAHPEINVFRIGSYTVELDYALN